MKRLNCFARFANTARKSVQMASVSHGEVEPISPRVTANCLGSTPFRSDKGASTGGVVDVEPDS